MQSLVSQQLFDELVSSLQKTLQFNTIKSDAKVGKPFGEGNAACLNYVLNLAESFGLKTQNFDNYAGHADFGEGAEVFGILGHLDVVPVTDGWTKPPFGGEILNGYLYGRGALDDKGPMLACLFAVKALIDEGYKPHKKIRLIFGCDEESGWSCMRYYAEQVKMPDSGISPDGDFPVINVEKGVWHVNLDAGALNDKIIDVFAGERINIVADNCVAVVGDFLEQGRFADITAVAEKDATKLTAHGKAAHGSTPQNGDNAVWEIFKTLAALYPSDKIVQFVNEKICSDFNGVNWGFPLEDKESGKITINIGCARVRQRHLILGLDIRYPVSYNQSQVESEILKNSPAGIKLVGQNSHDPLYVPEDTPLVQKLLKVYQSVTGKKAFPLAIGGATYARALPMCVAFGPVFPDDEKVIHEIDERVSLKRLREMTEIYYEAIKQLTTD